MADREAEGFQLLDDLALAAPVDRVEFHRDLTDPRDRRVVQAVEDVVFRALAIDLQERDRAPTERRTDVIAAALTVTGRVPSLTRWSMLE